MSNGGNSRAAAPTAWLCRSCKGPDGTPWRNRADNKKCFKCHILKTHVHLRVAGAGAGGGGGRQATGPAVRKAGKGSGQSAAQPAGADAAAKQEVERLTRRALDL